MIRFVCKYHFKDAVNGHESHELFTIDAEVPEVEEILRSGGFSPDSYAYRECIGIEVRDTKQGQ